MGELQKMF